MKTISVIVAAAVGLLAGVAPSGSAGKDLTTVAAPSSKPKTFLVVVAHPDDENIMGQVLARFARQGHKVQVIIATDGKDGTRVTKVPAGDLLGGLRRKESECACKKLGIQPPIFLSIDRLDTKNGVRAYLDGRKVLLAALKERLAALTPDALFTFGPDGEYGHSEHIVIGAAVTELLLRDGLVDRYPLYYFAWTKEQVLDDGDLSYADARYLDAKTGYTDEDEQKSFEAARCYATQSTPEEIDQLVRRESSDKANTLYFRRLHVGLKQGATSRAPDEF